MTIEISRYISLYSDWDQLVFLVKGEAGITIEVMIYTKYLKDILGITFSHAATSASRYHSPTSQEKRKLTNP